MSEIIVEIISVILDWLRKNHVIRFWVIILSSLLIIITIVSYVAAQNIYFNGALIIRELAPGFIFFFGIIFLLSLASLTNIKIKGRGIFEIELDTLHKERKKIQERLAEAPKPDIIDTIQLNLNQLTEYYTINKNQARNSFRFSIFALIVGFITIIGGIWLFYFNNIPNISLTLISSISGTLLEFIGGAYFYLYRKSIDQLNFFFIQLVKMQDTMLSIRLCEQITPEDKQIEIREKIIFTLLDRSSTSIQQAPK